MTKLGGASKETQIYPGSIYTQKTSDSTEFLLDSDRPLTEWDWVFLSCSNESSHPLTYNLFRSTKKPPPMSKKKKIFFFFWKFTKILRVWQGSKVNLTCSEAAAQSLQAMNRSPSHQLPLLPSWSCHCRIWAGMHILGHNLHRRGGHPEAARRRLLMMILLLLLWQQAELGARIAEHAAGRCLSEPLQFTIWSEERFLSENWSSHSPQVALSCCQWIPAARESPLCSSSSEFLGSKLPPLSECGCVLALHREGPTTT